MLDGELASTGFFNRPYLEHLIEAHSSGRREYSGPLWSLLMFEAFLRGTRQSTPASSPAATAVEQAFT